MPNERYLLTLLREWSDEVSPSFIDLFKTELERLIYNYGEHFSSNVPKQIPIRLKFRQSISKYSSFFSSYKDYKLNKKLENGLREARNGRKNILFASSLPARNRLDNFNKFSPIWYNNNNHILANFGLLKEGRLIDSIVINGKPKDIINRSFENRVNRFVLNLKDFYQDVGLSACFLFTDQYYWTKINFHIFKELKRKSFIFSHGLPGIYNNQVDNKSDYLLVWGNKIKENYVKAGFEPDKILVTGHPVYSVPNFPFFPEFSLEDVLVLPKATCWYQDTYEPISTDRGLMISYLEMIKSVLKRHGVKRARLRPHTSTNGNWLLSFFGNDFFVLDNLPLKESLDKATILIGPTSTVLLESSLNNKNYFIFEPSFNGKDIFNGHIVAPFDGSDDRIPVAKDTDELFYMIKNKIMIDQNFITDYIGKHDLSALNSLI